ncbi:hypothetical protein [Halomonas llamarensis]|uniref:Uncharacterized protein n=1 Tax=Halomonas llamarensis TaxID=2945104 RepID=A0ABT0STM0_9GAMM|nr:hypothetical protein [Halomonas llamarensis]MCL7931072.1 hypothetical protein [Halomonas llamarensis]
MARTTRKEPISEEQAEAIIITGWRVIDVTPPSAPKEITRHDHEPDAIEVARRFETKPPNEPGSVPDGTQDDDASQTNMGNVDE